MELDYLIQNCHLCTLEPDNAYGIINNAVLGVKKDKIVLIERQETVQPDLIDAQHMIDLDGNWVTPGLIDCHTHLVYGGNRADEFEQRLKGKSYQQIASEGGGIVSTVKATRDASKEALFDAAKQRLSFFLKEGVTGVEIKSGYGLNKEAEIKMLEVIEALGEALPVDVSATFLGAHTVAPEFNGDAEAYLQYLLDDILPEIHQRQLADAVDIFCETMAFRKQHVKLLFERARSLGFDLKIHAEQLSNSEGAITAARFKARSADHLEFVTDSAIQAMQSAGTVAVLLPGAYFFLNETQQPPIDLLRKYGVPIAIASDSNPGSSPSLSLLLMLNFACTLFKLTPLEALKGVTINAARALGWHQDCGTLTPGKLANLAFWDVEHPRELGYQLGGNPCIGTMYRGVLVNP